MSWDISLTKKQTLFVNATEDEIFYGGAAGGGKSYAVVIDACIKASQYPGIKMLLLRRTFPELERSIIRSFLEIVPKNMYKYNSSKHFVTFNNNSTLEFGYCDDDAAVYKYQSAEFDIIYLDEATHFSEYQVLYLKSRIRGANSFPKQYKFTSNPGNRGHVFFRERFIEPVPPMTRNVVPAKSKYGKEQSRIFIPSTVFENKFLMESDPDYVARLEDLPEDERRQLLEGDWYVFSGQMFSEFNRQAHVFHDFPERTKDWRIYTTMDYGLDMFAWYLIAENDKGTAYFLSEIHKPDIIISDAAKLIKQRLADLKIKKVDEALAPSDLWNRRQETGKSVADIFWENGIRLQKTSRDRVDGWAATKEWLKVFKDEQDIPTSKLKIHDSCVNLIKCIPLLQYDERRPNDASTIPHDITHSTDALRYFCVYRSRSNKEHAKPDENFMRKEKALATFVSDERYDVYGEKGDDDGDISISAGDYQSMYS